MFDTPPDGRPEVGAIVIGAGMGGLAVALRLRAAGMHVTLLDSHDWPGGKMRTVPSDAGPVDAGPTVLTMRHVFDELFATAGSRLEDHVALVSEPLLARHFWPDGSTLDLTSNASQNEDAIAAFAGEGEALAFRRFSREASELFALFDGPMMRTGEPSIAELAKAALSSPKNLGALSPGATLAGLLRRRFTDPRLIHLFGRYATYIGGSPYRSPALLALVWQAEAEGVWRIDGGMHKLAQGIVARFTAMGGELRLGQSVVRIDTSGAQVTGVTLASGEKLGASVIVHAGDPRAIATGRLGQSVQHLAQASRTQPRSLSAMVWSFAAKIPRVVPLAHHNVFFARSARDEFDALDSGAMPLDPTIYVCAEDRGSDRPVPDGPERFEIILNAAPLTEAQTVPDEEETCRRTTFQTLARFGLTFDPGPTTADLATPATFETLFPGSAGSLYGQTPHGMTAALKRPRARTAIRGLYLAGGGTHPGAGLPMAALSGKHAAEAILKDLVST